MSNTNANFEMTGILLGQEARKRKRGLRANGTKTYAKEITNCYN